MAVQPRQIRDWTVDEIVEVAATASGSRMTLAFLANDLTTIVLTTSRELAERLRADLDRTLREPPARDPGA